MKNLKQSFQSLSNKVTNQIKGCVQCNDSDCAKCKGNQNSFDYIFGERGSQPEPPVLKCFNYMIIDDPTCQGFNQSSCEWSIEYSSFGQQPFSFDWDSYMQLIFGAGVGGGGLYSKTSCSGSSSSFVLRVLDQTIPPNYVQIVDQNCNVNRQFFQQICDPTCWELQLNVNTAVNIIQNLGLDPFGLIYFVGGDPVNDPLGFNAYLLFTLQNLYGSGVTCSTTYDPVTKIATIRMFNIFTNSTPTLTYVTAPPFSQSVNLNWTQITC